MKYPAKKFSVSTYFWGLVLLLSFWPFLLKAEKTDIIILENGDRLTGEIKFMEQAILNLNTDAMSYIDIKWEKIVYVRSTSSFRVEIDNGELLFGMLDTDTLSRELIVGIGKTARRIPMNGVVGIRPVKESLKQGLTLSVDLGFTYTKASNILQFNVSGDGGYRTLFWDRNFSFRSVQTVQSDSSTTKNQNVDVSLYRLLTNRYYLVGFAGATQNTELSLKMRLSLGMGAGRYLLRTNSVILEAGIGLQGTREWKYGTAEIKNNLEGVIAAGFEKFKLFTPKFNLDIELKIYPNVTDPGRVRIDFDSKVKWELIKDLFWGITFYDNFDNRPTETETEKSQNDYGITLSLGWKY